MQTRTLRHLLLATTAIVLASLLVPIARVPYTCVYCRARRVDTVVFGGVLESRAHGNECSEWYRANIECAHAHWWIPANCIGETNLIGMNLGLSTVPGGNTAVNLFSPSTQLSVYQHFENPRDAKELFASLVDDESLDSWSHDDKFDRMLLKVFAIKDWESRGFPEPWDRWWDRYLADHAAGGWNH